MKVVDVAESYSRHGGGVRTYIHHKLASAAALGHDMVVVAPGLVDEEEAVEGGGRILYVKSPRAPFDSRYGLFRDERRIHALLDRLDPDIVEGSSPWNGGKFVARYRGRAKKAFVFHTDPVAVWGQTFLGKHLGFDRVDRLLSPWWKRIRALADAYDTTVVSGGWLRRRLREFGIEQTSVVPFGIDKRRFSPRKRDEQLRRRLLARCGMPPDAKLLIAISRLDPEKRISTLLDAFARVRRHRPVGLVILGRGALEGWYRRKAARVDGVHLHGYEPDREALSGALASADAFVHGSAAETYGLVVAEAVCSGVPVIVPDRGGAAALAGPEYAAQYRTADAEDCANAIERLLARDPARLAEACEAAAHTIGTMDDHFAHLFALYRQLRGQPPARPRPARSVACPPA